jgi:hypothetical protein
VYDLLKDKKFDFSEVRARSKDAPKMGKETRFLPSEDDKWRRTKHESEAESIATMQSTYLVSQRHLAYIQKSITIELSLKSPSTDPVYTGIRFAFSC